MIKYKISVNDEKLQKEINHSHDKIEEILYFFNVNNIDIHIKVLCYVEFKSEFYDYLEHEINGDTTGFIEDDRNAIILLNYDDYKFTNHKGESYDQYVKVAIHEFVHIVHSIACKHNYPSDDLWEGIAVYLSEQYDFKEENGSGKFYDYGKQIYEYLKIHSRDELLKKLLGH